MKERSAGTKVTKKRNVEKKEAEKGDVEERPAKNSIYEISLSILKSNAVMRAKEKARKETAKNQLQSEREKYWMQQAAAQFGLESDAPEEEKEFAPQLMCKQTINSFADKFNQRAREALDEIVKDGIVQCEDTTPTPQPENPHILTILQGNRNHRAHRKKKRRKKKQKPGTCSDRQRGRRGVRTLLE